MSYINELLFGFYPYLAGTVFLLGSLLRFDRDQYTWRSGSSQMLSGKSMRLASNLFHVGILLLFVGHFVGLLMPHSWYPYFGLTAASKQLMAVVAGGISDIFILWLLYAQLILGILSLPISLSHSDGSTMLLLADWAQRIVTFQGGAAESVMGVSIIFKLHLLLGITIFLVFPFTRLVHIWSAPIWYLGRAYQIVRVKGATTN